MWECLRRWLLAIPYGDPLERRQAVLLQAVALCIAVVALLMLPIAALASVDPRRAGMFAMLLCVLMLSGLRPVALARRGLLSAAAVVMASALALLLSVILHASTLAGGAVQLFALARDRPRHSGRLRRPAERPDQGRGRATPRI